MEHLTALISCFARAYHTRMNRTPVFSDPYAGPLLGKDYDAIAAHMKQGIPFFLPGFKGDPEEGLRRIADRVLSPSVLARSAFCEDLLRRMTSRGCGQYVLLAAGYDTFGIRSSDPGLTVFEVDLPDLLADKAARLRSADLTSRAVQVPCDLADPGWKTTLEACGFDPSRTAFMSLLGISYYLEPETFRSLIETLSKMLRDGSGICFDYPTAEEGEEDRIRRALASGAGEPMKPPLSQEELRCMLEEASFEIREDLSPKEMNRRYFSVPGLSEDDRIEAPRGVRYLFAVKKEEGNP